MSKQAHTPGPWRAKFRKDATDGQFGAEITPAGMTGPSLAHIPYCRAVRGSAAANATMMAAAPEMLEALHLALEALPKPDHLGELLPLGNPYSHAKGAPLDRNNCACALHRAHVAVRTAIKKAEGK